MHTSLRTSAHTARERPLQRLTDSKCQSHDTRKETEQPGAGHLYVLATYRHTNTTEDANCSSCSAPRTSTAPSRIRSQRSQGQPCDCIAAPLKRHLEQELWYPGTAQRRRSVAVMRGTAQAIKRLSWSAASCSCCRVDSPPATSLRYTGLEHFPGRQDKQAPAKWATPPWRRHQASHRGLSQQQALLCWSPQHTQRFVPAHGYWELLAYGCAMPQTAAASS